MPVEFQYIDESGQVINPASGIDFGTSRKGVPNITKFKVKNIGNVTARDCIILANTQNRQDDVSETEYERQLLAQKWKSFSLYPDHSFTKQLHVGRVKPGRFVEGTKETDVPFVSADNCPFKEDWTVGVTEFKSNTHIFKKLDDEPKGQVAKRMNFPSLPLVRDFEVEFKISFNSILDDERTGNPFIAFPVRINSKGDGRGYIFMLHYRQEDKKFMVTIYKNGKGMTTNMDRDYGSKLFDTILWQSFDPNKKFTFKIYNNSKDQPTFQVKYGDKVLTLAKSSDSDIQGTEMTDTAKDAYVEAGAFYKDISLYDGDISVTMSAMSIKTEELEQFIYMRTILEDNAENGTTYNSAVAVSYLED